MKIKGIHEGGSGKIGNLVSCYRYGKYYLRTLPAKVKQPNTPKQLAARQKFKLAQAFASTIKEFAQFGFAAYAQQRTAYSAAISFLLNNAFSGEYPDIELDYNKVRVTIGTRPTAKEVEMNFSNKILQINWLDTYEIRQTYAHDAVVILLVDPSRRWHSSYFGKAVRNDASLELCPQIPDSCSNIHVYLSFYGQNILNGKINEKDISHSIYCGQL